MAESQNGYIANNRAYITRIAVPGGQLSVRKGHVATIIEFVAVTFHNRVEPLMWPGCWGYAERSIRGDTELSNHASGTAIDLNAPKHPLGKRGTFTVEQVMRIRREILNPLEGAIRWGGDYRRRPDEMHFEIDAGVNEVHRIANKITQIPQPSEDDMASSDEILAELKALRGELEKFRKEEKDRYVVETDRWSVEAARWRAEAERDKNR